MVKTVGSARKKMFSLSPVRVTNMTSVPSWHGKCNKKTRMTKSDLRSFFLKIYSSICFLNFNFPVSLFFCFSVFCCFCFFAFLVCVFMLFCFSASALLCFSVLFFLPYLSIFLCFFPFFWFFSFFTVLLLQCLLGLPFSNANQFEDGQFRYTINQPWINPPPTTKKMSNNRQKIHTLNLSQTDRTPIRINPN